MCINRAGGIATSDPNQPLSHQHSVSQSIIRSSSQSVSQSMSPPYDHHNHHHHPPVLPFSLHSSEIARQSSRAIHLNKENCLRAVINGKKLLYN